MIASRVMPGAVLLFALSFFGAGCLNSGSPSTAFDGGVFRTSDQAVTWKQPTALSLGSKIGSIADVGTTAIAFDPQDPQAIYVGTSENGLIYTLDGAESWQSAKGLSTGTVNAVSVNAKDPCIVYVAKANQIIKTATCGREWAQIFFDERTDKRFTAVVADWFNPRIVYAGTSEGDLLRSDDAGGSWRVLTRVEGTQINDLVMDPRDSRTLYAATNGAGLYKTTDGGAKWTEIREPFDAYEGARRPLQVVLDQSTAGVIMTVSRYGLLRSDDAGASWRALTLPNPPGTVLIKSLVIHPTNPRIIVYATDASIVITNDGGSTWTSKKLPTKRGVSFVDFDRHTPPVFYLGAASKKK